MSPTPSASRRRRCDGLALSALTLALCAALPACNFNKVAANQTASILQEAEPALDGFWDYDMAGAGIPGSVLQLVPTEVMIKQPAGTNPATKDWEFFELDVDENGSKIRKRGFADVVNRFGGNCFACHVAAKPEWDMICEKGHGCQKLPIPHMAVKALQNTDPRCKGDQQATTFDKFNAWMIRVMTPL